MSVVDLKKVSRVFGDLTAINDLSFSVEAGEIFGLVGPDGAGKTTCLRMLCGLLKPTSGQMTVLGEDVVSDPESVKSEIGYMSQRFGLYEDLSVAENIEFYAEL
ncbi:MAG: ATP-binding cassette domain-containing protein, partial [Deltaproteobacteria bacterium]|nr:ATP-binding cassette domain-containing protein [Deltaproteobacteria bacterium]